MDDRKMHLKILAHEKVVYDSDINELYVSATDGKIGILKDHVPVVCALDIGVTKVVTGKGAQQIAVMGGILQFSDNNAVILTDNAELDCDIDVARAKQAKERAEARIRAKDENLDMVRAQIALAKAIARINARNETIE